MLNLRVCPKKKSVLPFFFKFILGYFKKFKRFLNLLLIIGLEFYLKNLELEN